MKKNIFSVSEFKSKSLGLLERVSRTGEAIIVTKRGKPIAKVIPMGNSEQKPIPGRLRDTLIEKIDLVTPFGAKLWKAAEPKFLLSADRLLQEVSARAYRLVRNSPD